MDESQSSKHAKPLGLWTATSLVTGNMIGSGIFLLPSALALYGGISLYGWIFSALGSLTLAYVFSSLVKSIKGSGGPYIYTRAQFGELPGFLVAWGYWISIIATNAAIAIALVGYLSVFFPILKEQNIFTASVNLLFIWFLVWINIRGVRTAGRLQLSTTLIKILPLFAMATIGIFYIEPSHFEPWNLSNDSDLSAVAATAALTMWAFLGMESANIPAAEVSHPEKNVARAAVLGTFIAACLYIPSSIAVFGIIEPSTLAQSSAPFADAAAILWGDWGYYLFGAGAVISCFGALNGWTLCIGQIPMAAADDGLFPKTFAERSVHGTPKKGIIISTVLVSLLVLMNYQENLVSQFTFVILLATLAAVLPYLVCSLAQFLIFIRRKNTSAIPIPSTLISLVAIGFSIWILINTGTETILWGSGLLMLGLPVYFWMKKPLKS